MHQMRRGVRRETARAADLQQVQRIANATRGGPLGRGPRGEGSAELRRGLTARRAGGATRVLAPPRRAPGSTWAGRLRHPRLRQEHGKLPERLVVPRPYGFVMQTENPAELSEARNMPTADRVDQGPGKKEPTLSRVVEAP